MGIEIARLKSPQIMGAIGAALYALEVDQDVSGSRILNKSMKKVFTMKIEKVAVGAGLMETRLQCSALHGFNTVCYSRKGTTECDKLCRELV